MQEITTQEARDKFGEVIEQVRLADERYVITRYGKPAAVIVPVDWYMEIKRKLGDEA
jgi:prevent-host-death family protein